ncbi:hypothetical protein DV735_g1332, partial [Chaetothyriales sp. CBS 134920]
MATTQIETAPSQPTAAPSSVAALGFSSLPPFPDDVPTAPLLRLSLKALLAHDQDETARFAAACEELGFFYLDLSDCAEGQRLLSDADKLFGVGKELFELPVEEKRQYDFAKQNTYFGYKGYGAHVLDRQGNLDRNEFYNVSKDDVFGLGKQWPAPTCIEAQKPLLKSFMTNAHGVVTLVLELLNDHLKLPTGLLQSMHRLTEGHSGDQVRFIKAPPQPQGDRRTALGEHTDFGSVTVLFNRLGGLQVLPPGRDAEWCYVKPLPGHAIINLGDAMVKFTNGRLRSNIHRVNSPPGLQAEATRYSLVYFNRPEDDVMLRRLEGSDMIPPLMEGEVEEEITSKDWIIRRGLGKRHELKGKEAFDFDNDKSRGTEERSRRAYM